VAATDKTGFYFVNAAMIDAIVGIVNM